MQIEWTGVRKLDYFGVTLIKSIGTIEEKIN